MASHFDIQDIKEDEKTYSRCSHVRVGTGRASFETPCRPGIGNVTDFDIYEVYRRVSPETVERSLSNEAYARKFDGGMESRCKGRFNILIMEYDSKEVVPNSRMVEFMSHMQYNHTDVIATPSWFSLVTKDDHTDTDLYIQLTDEYLEAASRRNHKPIMVTIPQSTPPDRINEILERYIGRDVTAFCIDSNSRALLNGSWIRKFQTSMDSAKEDYGIERECLVYSVNAYQGLIRRNEVYSDAKDFLGFIAGADLIGGKHTKAYGSRGSEQNSTVARVFDPETYTYSKVFCSLEEKDAYTDGSIRAQIGEMPNVGRSIREGELESLLMSKPLTDVTKRSIYRLRDSSRMTRLNEFI